MVSLISKSLVPFFVLTIVVSMLLPLPEMALDFLLIGNLILSLLLLFSALSVADPMRLSSLPGLLLLLTMLRLALNISTTRAILSTGEAGKAVETFGSVVVGGNALVGLIIFSIITVIQFIVIAKGAERVAEVSARFTLDALPGKQMSIDADVRAGLLDLGSARDKRKEVQVEARFYGALDGAMKFVKGDAIAGMIIAVINIVGGLLSGLILEGLEFRQAIAKYLILSIGDGLLSQIPALLNSLAAGMVVTRVVTGEGATLSEELYSQLNSISFARNIAAMACIALALLPGMPTAVCLIMGLLVLMAGNKVRPVETQSSPAKAPLAPRIPPLIAIKLSREAAQRLHEEGALPEAIDLMREEFYQETGLLLPRPDLQILQSDMVKIEILHRGVPYGSITDVTVKAVVDSLKVLIKSRAPELIDDSISRRMLDHYEALSPEIVAAVVPAVLTLSQFTELLRMLVQENVSILNLDLILQSVSESSGRNITVRQRLEEVRILLRRQIVHSNRAPDGRLNIVTLDPVMDVAVSTYEADGEAFPADLQDTIVGRLEEVLETADTEQLVLLVSRRSRRLLAECLMLRRIEMKVLALEEAADEEGLNIVKTVTFEDVRDREVLLEKIAA